MALNIEKVKILMIKKNINNSELADKMNVTKGRVSNILAGKAKTVRANTFNKLATALGVDVEEIIE